MNDIRKYVRLIESYERLDESFKDAQASFEKQADAQEVKQYIERFKELSKRNVISGQDKDIGKWIKAGWEEFKTFMDEASTKVTRRAQKKKVKKDAIEIFNDGTTLAIVPLTKEASCVYGSNTKWCTAASQNNMFDQYFMHDQLVLIYAFVSGEKYAIVVDRGYNKVLDVYNSEDRSIKQQAFNEVSTVSAFELMKHASAYANKIEYYAVPSRPVNDALLSMVNGTLTKAQREIIEALDSGSLYFYINGKTDIAFHYLKEFDGKHRRLLSKLVLSDPEYALRYAKEIVGGQSPVVEKALREHPDTFYRYIKEVDPDNESWKEIFKESPKNLFLYAVNIKQGRIDEYLEAVILEDDRYAEEYLEKVVVPYGNYAGGRVFEYFVLFGTDEQKEKAYRDALEDIVSGDDVLDMFLGLESPDKRRSKEETIANLERMGYTVDKEFEEFIDDYIARQ